MIIAVDTSAFVKLIVDEDGSDDARRWFDTAALAATSVVTYPETCSALTRRARDGGPASRLQAWLSALEARWAHTTRIHIDERLAGSLAIKHGLRGMDAIHLAASIAVRERALARSSSASVAVAAFDRRLLEAAEREGFATLGGPAS
jgi:uncharacterized protein